MNLAEPRLQAALAAARGAGAALQAVRGEVTGVERGGQLKTAVDRAAEGWVVGWLRACFPDDEILAEEAWDDTPVAPTGPHWTVDALDGTRSFVEGFAGYTCQVAWIDDEGPAIGVIDEPAAGRTVFAVRGQGAWVRGGERLPLVKPAAKLRFVDSTLPSGVIGAWLASAGGAWVECGGVGAKALRVADGTADVYAKAFRFKRWDVAPAAVILGEVGARIGHAHGAPIGWYDPDPHGSALLATPAALWSEAVARLNAEGRSAL